MRLYKRGHGVHLLSDLLFGLLEARRLESRATVHCTKEDTVYIYLLTFYLGSLRPGVVELCGHS